MPKPTDTQRLDWIEDANNIFKFVPQMDGGVYIYEFWAHELGGDEDTGLYFKSLRKAIDVAMRSDEPK